MHAHRSMVDVGPCKTMIRFFILFYTILNVVLARKNVDAISEAKMHVQRSMGMSHDAERGREALSASC